ncbi:AMP-binding protein [Defluviimonas sp. 20V17]|uniref:Acyl-CoA synthetase n=1 Tax=Allgaiera indica TaxID=765699 RepID=A0AAN5A117_9RHOB|nr:acyl-CoA synthetase [Allgaiera indica]KDB05474.1 AMP-binding protein [Defluviimonas sp. 20V17]GHE04650.1 acyl-CoA synthetase [Allgaiera indica]SDX47801.1 fatty-acyl-CoA synthase [Allgaiera indica]
MGKYATLADRNAIEAEAAWEGRDLSRTMYRFLSETADRHPDQPAVSFQILSGPADPAETLSWAELRARVTQAANLFRSLGIGPDTVVAFVMPNANETVVTLLGGAVAGIVNPINPLLDAEQIGAILRETGAKVVVTLKGFPKTDVGQKVAQAVVLAPKVETVLEVDLNRYLTGVKRLLVPLVRPKIQVTHKARVLDFNRECNRHPADRLTFEDPLEDRFAAYFHTGGTTGMPKVAQHKVSGMIYNGWLGERLLFRKTDRVICPLPLFHVFAAYPVLMSAIASGAHVIFPTPAGYRGEGVVDNFWKLVERWKITYVIAVPTAISALMQRKIDADVSTLRFAFSGSAPLPVELYKRFEAATGVTICEGYGLTEATCLVSINPPDGEKKIGSVGLPFPHTDVRILMCDEAGNITRECGPDEVGEICVANPGVVTGQTYTDDSKNTNLYAGGTHLRTGDLGRIDPDGYLFITGRAKDLIIRGGHNIDPAEIEEALAGHEAVAFAGAIGQPDAHSGELPCAYVELVAGADVTVEELLDYARANIHERAAIPRHIEILPELPKTAVGKVFKPELRKRAIKRVYDAALAEAGLAAEVAEVVEDKKRGLVARLRKTGEVDPQRVAHTLGELTRPWEWDAE